MNPKRLKIILIFAAIIGTISGFEIYAANQLQYKIEEIVIDEVEIKFSGLDVDLRIYINLTNPTGIPVWVSGGTYSMKVNGIAIGTGNFGEINPTNKGGMSEFTLNATGLSLNLAPIIANYIIGTDINVEITITSIKLLWIIPIPTNIVKTETININA